VKQFLSRFSTRDMIVAAILAFAVAAILASLAGHPLPPEMLASLGGLGMVPIAGEISLKDEVLGAIKESSNKLSDAIAKSDKELKDLGAVSLETKNEIADLSKKHATLDERMVAFEQEVADVIANAKKGSMLAAPESLGARFLKMDEVKDFAARFARQKFRGVSMPLEMKDITSAVGSAGPGIWSQREDAIVSAPHRPRMLRSLIPTIPVGTNLIEWVQTNVRTNNAAAVAEGGAKPKSDITYLRKETAVRKLAHYFKTSMEALQDFPRLQAEIDSEGMEMLRQVEEDQLLAGDGTGVNLLGLIPQATAYNVAATVGGDTPVDVIRRAILQVRQSYYGSTGIVLNPADWAAIELLKDTQDNYLFSAVTSGATPRLWGLPVVESDALPAGRFMTGAFATAASIYDRMAAVMMISTENEDDFIKNMVSILFEERLALAVKRPAAFIYGKTSGAA
jgi:HK97 family phage major capsid protein